MLSSPDTLQMLLTGFISMSWNMALAWLLRYLQPKQNFLNHLVTVLRSKLPSPFANNCFWLLPLHYGLVQTLKAHVLQVDYVASSPVWFSNFTWSDIMHNVSVHQQPQQVPSMAQIASVIWDTHHKLNHGKIFDSTLYNGINWLILNSSNGYLCWFQINAFNVG